jgi:outer membrane protein insertion porin family
MTRPIINISLLLLLLLLLSACSGLKHLPDGELLYTGAEVQLEHDDKISGKKKRLIKNAAEDVLRPEPNNSFLGLRPRLWMYNVAGDEPNRWLGKWLKKRGRAPVLLSSVKQGATTGIIDARLFNIGVFNAYTGFETIEKKRTAKVIYTSYIHKPYTIGEYNYAVSNDSLSRAILSVKHRTIIEPGLDYNLDLLKVERERIDDLLKHRGYFYFNADYLIFIADTSAIDRTVSLTLTLKDDVPENALTVYRINKVFIDQHYSISEEFAGKTADTLRYHDKLFAGKETEMSIRPGVISRSVFLKKDEIYTRRNHTITLNRLMAMGSFKFVQVKFNDSDTTAAGYLDVEVLMTPMTKRTFRAEVDIVSKSNNYTGPRMNVSLLNRNTFKGAELLYISMAGSYEAQLSGNENLYSYSLNPQVELVFPRFILPWNLKTKNRVYLPKTRLSLSYNYLKRIAWFDMRTIQFGFGYRWRESNLKEHELNPISLSNTTIRNKSATFNELLESNPFLKKSYEEQFIAGANYTFTYNEQVLQFRKIQFLAIAAAETAGNTFSLANIIGGDKPSAENPSKVIGSVYSQYAKLSLDGRGYYNFRDKNKLAMRLYAGVAKPYGNAAVLPYSKQFFSGGSNSIRAFHINSVGPGTYNQDSINIGFLQLGGDIKLEISAEYRFNIYRFFKGAIFVDAGNVWLHEANPDISGSPFLFSEFMDEIAVGTGVGIRIDVSFFLLRFDLAMPLRKPWLEENNRWVINQISFGSKDWRRDNLVLNVAIGYPF